MTSFKNLEIRRTIKKEIALIEEMMFCLISQKAINKQIARRDELEELMFLFR